MEQHKYSVGQTVRFARNTSGIGLRVAPIGDFQVIGLLPDTQGRNQYRVKSISDGHQRVATENEINVR